MEDGNIDLAFITETWLHSDKNTVTSMLREAGYMIHHHHREDRRGGGIGIIYKQCFIFNKVKVYDFKSFECFKSTLSGKGSQNMNFIVIYRHGEWEVCNSTFFLEFHNFMEEINLAHEYFVMLGDFNLHVNERFNSDIVKFSDILTAFGLIQSVKGATHKAGNTLDLIIHDPAKVDISNINIDLTTASDHAFITFNMKFDI